MSDLIDRQAAIDAMYALLDTIKDCGEYAENPHIDIIVETLEELPAAQSERKKGAPIYKHGESVVHISYADGHGGFESQKWAEWVCPECGWFVGEQYVPRRHNQNKANFCARCGCEIDWDNAKMEDEE